MKRLSIKLTVAGLVVLGALSGGCAEREREAYFTQQSITIMPRTGDQQVVAFPELDGDLSERTAQR